MSRINPEDYFDFEEIFQERVPRIKKGRKPTKSDKEQRKKEIAEAKGKRVKEVKELISFQLRYFPDFDTPEGQAQAELYLKWLENSLKMGFALMDDKDLQIKTSVSSVKAGGQQRQKNRTSVRVRHLPTLISIKNEDERVLGQNVITAKANLFTRLENHFKLWQIIKRDSPSPLNLEMEIKDLLQAKEKSVTS